jgi:signal transduction histidine kinase
MTPKASDLSQAAEESFEVSFVADVHLIQVLGEHLISSEKVGILELIKNAYDASATQCDVWIEKVPGLPEADLSDPQIAELPGPVITIIDNGSGMDETALREGWLRPATRIKTSIKERLKREREQADERGTRAEYESLVASLKREYGGRLPLGEKGVGRFATHRLGRHLTLQTKTKDKPREWMLNINWDDFEAPDDRPRDLQSVPLTLVRRKTERDYGPTDSGTMLRIYGGREGYEWTDDTVREVGQAIWLLRSPDKVKETEEAMGFKVDFHCPQLAGEKFEVPTKTIPAPFECTAIVDEEGKAEIEIRLRPPPSLSKPLAPQTWSESIDLRTLPPDDNKSYWRTDGPRSPMRRPECGPFTLEVKLWLRLKRWIEYPDWREFTRYLDQFGGIGTYRDGWSIVPADVASQNDWLRLSRRHIKKGTRISYYQMWGGVDLVQEDTLNLVDRTSREGMLETRAFRDLSELVRTIVLDVLEFRVKETRDHYRRLQVGDRIPRATLNRQAGVGSKILDKVSSDYNFEADELGLVGIVGESEDPGKTIATVADAVEELRREIKVLEDQSDALTESAGYGIAIAVAVHEIEKITSNLYFGLERLSKKISLLADTEAYMQSQELARVAQALLNELKRLAPLRVVRLERRREFGVRSSILAATGAFRLAWEDLGVGFIRPVKEQDFEVFGSFGACSQVFANLFDNATYWLQSVDPDKRRIIVRMDPDKRRVVVADNGPGIAEKMRPHLFEPYYSLKNPPSGLGLYICRYYMQQMKGAIRESLESEKVPGFSGAHFTLQFPKKAQEGEE